MNAACSVMTRVHVQFTKSCRLCALKSQVQANVRHAKLMDSGLGLVRVRVTHPNLNPDPLHSWTAAIAAGDLVLESPAIAFSKLAIPNHMLCIWASSGSLVCCADWPKQNMCW